MEIRIQLDRREPPEGRLCRADPPQQPDTDGADDTVEFVGWLGLLRELSRMLGAADGQGAEPG